MAVDAQPVAHAAASGIVTSRLIVAPNWIGDAVMSLPLLRAVRRRHPEDRLAVLARPGPGALYLAQGVADEVIPRRSLAADVAASRARRFDEAWLLPNSFRAALLAFLSGAPRRRGYAADARGWLLTDALPHPSGSRHQLRDYDELLRAAGVPPDEDPPRLPIPAAAALRAAEALAAASLPPDEAVVLCPASASAPSKRWPAERFAALADLLAQRGIPRAVAVGPSERGLAQAVQERSGSPLPLLGPDLDAIELAAVLARARLVVSNDSGPAHLAGAVGTPVVVLFGPTDPARTAPSGSPTRVLYRDALGTITADEAMRAVEELLGRKG